jgi:hypothetical protein
MKRFLAHAFPVLFLLMSIPACTLGQPTPTELDTVQTTVAPALAVQPSATDAPYPAPTIALQPSATFGPYPAPTSVPEDKPTQGPSPTSTSTPDLFPNATRIQFAAGETWTEVVGKKQPEGTTNFVLSVMEGQVMSVSVFEGHMITIQGKDGTFLTPPGNNGSDSQFWRGILPTTQDYLITVDPLMDEDFRLRVTINPPGQAEQIFEYNNPQYQLGFNYSDSFAPTTYPYIDQQRGAPALVLNFIDSAFYDTTNLAEAYFVLNIFDDPNIIADCSQPSFPQEQAQGQETFGGYVFDKSTAGGVATGNIYELTIYRTVQKNACIEIVFFIHFSNIGNFTPGAVTEFDRDALLQKLTDVLKTFTLK